MTKTSLALVIYLFASIFCLPRICPAFSTSQAADVVIGQPNMYSNTANNGGVSGKTLYMPQGMYSDGSRLYVCDNYNHRVLIYTCIPFTNYTAADIVIGQPDMSGNSRNQGTTVTAHTLWNPAGVSSDGVRLFVADPGNHRVLIFNRLPATDNAGADVVIGQPTMLTNTATDGFVAGNTLRSPYDLFCDGTRLYVADNQDHRVLIYNSIPNSNYAAADVVVGQPSMLTNTANNGGLGAASLYHPQKVAGDGTRLLIADQYNHRVLIYNRIPDSNYAAADVVVGQAGMTANSPNQGGSPLANTLSLPAGLAFTGTRLFNVDCWNSRVLEYPSLPWAANAQAVAALGQPNLTSSGQNNGGIGPNTLNWPDGIFKDHSKLYVADLYNHRVLIYHSSLHAASVYPSHALIGASVSVTVTGADFDRDVSIKLVSPFVTIPGTQLQHHNSFSLGASFTLLAAPGYYDVYLEKGDDRALLRQAFLVQTPASGAREWSMQDLGQAGGIANPGTKGGLKIGDPDHDGAVEIYAAVRDTKIFRLQYSGGVWTWTQLPEGAEYYQQLVLADMNREGFPEMFAAAANQHVYAFTGCRWRKDDCLNLGSMVEAVAAGDGDRDGKNEIYAACRAGSGGTGKLYACEINQGSWVQSEVGHGADHMLSLVFGDGNQDGRAELYGGNADRHIYQFSYNGTGWSQLSVAALADQPLALELADADSDGSLELYAATDSGEILQILEDGGDWPATRIASCSAPVGSLAAGDADQDGVTELYGAGEDGRLHQFCFNGAYWESKVIGVVSAALLDLDIGDADMDGQQEIYALAADNHLYAFKMSAASPSPTPTPLPDKRLRAYPSRFNPERGETASIRWVQAESTGTTIRIYTLRGELVRTLLDHAWRDKGREWSIAWDGTNLAGRFVASGIYIVLLEAGDYRDRIKLCVLK